MAYDARRSRGSVWVYDPFNEGSAGWTPLAGCTDWSFALRQAQWLANASQDGDSEIEKFLDTPVKRYSSGMYVRLAFAVAAHLDPEILIVDEVLAVGDAQFQQKCLGKMGQVSRSGRTVLFVSHTMTAVKALCTRAVLLERGVPEAQITTRVDVSEWVERKRASMRAHASQISEASFFLALPEQAFRYGFGTEWFIRDGQGPGITETDLLAGL